MPRSPAARAMGTAPEERLVGALRRLGIVEFERAPQDVAGKPDVYLRHRTPRALAVFVDGCAWHGCPVHYKPAKSETHGLSQDSVARQRHHDRVTRAALRSRGVEVLAFWEHELIKSATSCARKVREAVECRA